MSQSFSSTNIRFAYWVPGVNDGLVVSTIPQRTDWSLKYNQKLAQTAEKAGFDYTLSQIRFTAGYGVEYQHGSVSLSQAILHATTKLKVFAAILPGPWYSAVVAKQLTTIDHISNGRITISVVSGWFKGEFQALDKPRLKRDERYRRSNEFIRMLKGIWTQDKSTFRGDFYRINDYTLSPEPLQKPHPKIFQGGSSRAAHDDAASVSDWYFTNGNTPERIKTQISDIQAKARENGHAVRIGVSTSIIACDTEEGVRAVLDDIIKHAHMEAARAFSDAAKQADKASPESEGNWTKSTSEDLTQYNDGFRTNLIGAPQQITERIMHLKSIGVDLILVGFPHFIKEVEYSGRKVPPLVRELGAQCAATSGTTDADTREAKTAISAA